MEFTISKAKRSLGKVQMMIKGRYGLPLNIGVELYKVLVRMHLEYSIPAWANMSPSDLKKMEDCQALCLRKIAGAKRNSSIKATEVILRILPFRLRIQELCCREYVRIMAKSDQHILKRLLNTSFRIQNKFTPFAFIELKSKVLIRQLGNSTIEKDYIPIPDDILSRQPIPVIDLFKTSIGNSRSRSNEQQRVAQDTFAHFQSSIKGRFVSIYTDGSVARSSNSCGAGAAILVPKDHREMIKAEAKVIGHLSDNVKCEIKGISIGLELALSHFKEKEDPNDRMVFICCDCISAIDVVSKQQSFENHAKSLREINGQVKELKALGIKPYLIWCPAHCNIEYNEMADKVASDADGSHWNWTFL